MRASHERWDGTGYPDGLAGEEIPLGARIVAVCDAFDAMTTDRPYRRRIDADSALAELRAHARHPVRPRGRRGLRAADRPDASDRRMSRRGSRLVATVAALAGSLTLAAPAHAALTPTITERALAPSSHPVGLEPGPDGALWITQWSTAPSAG